MSADTIQNYDYDEPDYKQNKTKVKFVLNNFTSLDFWVFFILDDADNLLR